MGAAVYPDVLTAIRTNFSQWYDSVTNSRAEESLCGGQPAPTPVPPPTPPVPTPPPRDCCDACKSTTGCMAADFNNVYKEFGVPHPHGVHLESRDVDLSSAAGYKCHLKKTFQPKVRTDGSVACVPNGALSV